MSERSDAHTLSIEQQLDRAYPRVLKVTVALGAIVMVGGGLAVSWRSGLGAALGAFIGTVNLVWLHQGAGLLVQRMMAAGGDGSSRAESGPSAAGSGPSAAGSGPSKLRVALFFPLRYLAVIAAVYAILKGYPGVLVSFIVGLALPIMALMGEGIYEAVLIRRVKPPLP